MKKTKEASKYIPQSKVETIYEKLTGSDKALFKLLHLTGIRVSEVEVVVQKYLQLENGERYIDFTPAKRNNKRLIPKVLEWEEVLELNDISLKTETIKQRVRRWNIGISPHDLRATFITNALEKEINPIKLLQITGHKDIRNLLKYNRLSSENSMWMYEYITSTNTGEWARTDDVNELKEQLSLLTKQHQKLKDKNKRLKEQLNEYV